MCFKRKWGEDENKDSLQSSFPWTKWRVTESFRFFMYYYVSRVLVELCSFLSSSLTYAGGRQTSSCYRRWGKNTKASFSIRYPQNIAYFIVAAEIDESLLNSILMNHACVSNYNPIVTILDLHVFFTKSIPPNSSRITGHCYRILASGDRAQNSSRCSIRLSSLKSTSCWGQ